MNMKTPLLRTALRPGLLLLLLAMALPATLSHAAANPPQFMACQGYLTDGNGNPLGSTNTGPKNYNVVFRIWDLQTGGTTNGSDELYAEQQTVTVNNGVFSVLLGQGSAYSIEPHTNQLSGLFVGASSSRFLEFTVLGIGASGVNITILPRLQLLTSPYSFLAANAVNAISAGSLVNNNNATQVVTVTNGSVGIATTTPISALDVAGTATIEGSLNAYNALHAGGNVTTHSQGAFLEWNKAGDGALNLVNQKGLGVGGFHFDEVDTVNNLTERLTINSSGYVGIGTTNPAQPLEVNGNAQVDGFLTAKNQISIDSAGNNAFLQLFDTTDSADFRLGVASSTGNFSSSAAVGDAVIRNTGKLLLESGVGAAAITISTANNVGIGTTTPARLLEVNGDDQVDGTIWAGDGHIASQTMAPLVLDSSGDICFRHTSPGEVNTFSDVFHVTAGGYAGIGTITPSYPLDIEISGAGGAHAYYYYSTSTVGSSPPTARNGSTGSFTLPYSFWASGAIACTEIDLISDGRVKEIVDRSDSQKDLAMVRQLRITDYRKVDKAQYGGKLERGVIAQEVEKVIPEAVNTSTNYIPNIYSVVDTVTCTNHLLQLGMSKPHGLAVGDTVRLFADESQLEVKVIQVSSPTNFAVASPARLPQRVFVYGKQVSDFRTVDYDRLFATGLGAIQELAKQVDQIKAQNLHEAELERKVADLQKQVAHEAVLDQEVSDLKKLVAQLARNGASSRQTAQADEPAQKTLATASLDR